MLQDKNAFVHAQIKITFFIDEYSNETAHERNCICLYENYFFIDGQ